MRLLHTALASVNAAQNEYFVGTISGNKFKVEQRSLLDYLLLASADELMVMFRSAFPLLSNEYHVGGRRTHIFVGQPFMHAVQHVVDRADAPRCVRAKDECRLLARLWDILGDSGKWE